MISNIGYKGEHYSCESSPPPHLNKKTFNLEKLIHPREVEFNEEAINRIYDETFEIIKIRINYHWYEYLFSVKNVEKYSIWTILGVKLKFKYKKRYDEGY